MPVRLFDIFVDCATCDILAPDCLSLDQYLNKYKAINDSKISGSETQLFLSALYSFNFPGIEQRLDVKKLNIMAQNIIHAYLIQSRLKELMARSIFEAPANGENDILGTSLRIRDVLASKIKRDQAYLGGATTYIFAEIYDTKYSSHVQKILKMFENGDLFHISKSMPFIMLQVKRLREFLSGFYQLKNGSYKGDKNRIMDFIEFENMMSMENVLKLKNSPVRYQISRYYENDYSCEDAYGYMDVLDNNIKMEHENTKSVMIENLVLAQAKSDYPNDLKARLIKNFNQMHDTADIKQLFNHVIRQK